MNTDEDQVIMDAMDAKEIECITAYELGQTFKCLNIRELRTHVLLTFAKSRLKLEAGFLMTIRVNPCPSVVELR